MALHQTAQGGEVKRNWDNTIPWNAIELESRIKKRWETEITWYIRDQRETGKRVYDILTLDPVPDYQETKRS